MLHLCLARPARPVSPHFSAAKASRFLTGILLASLATACSSTDVSMNAPSTVKCQVTVGNQPGTLPAAGTSGTLQLSTTRDCTWAVSGAPAWLTITGPASGQGSSDVGYRVAGNPDPTVRRGSVTVNDAQVPLEQEGTPCRFGVSPAEASFDVGGGAVALRVDTGSAACSWTTASQSAWLHTTTGTTAGPGSTTVRADANTGAARRGVVVVAGQSVSIEQAGVPVTTPTPDPTPDPKPAGCAYAVDVSSVSIGAGGGTGVVVLTTTATCAWTAASDASWLSVTGAASGSGPASIAYAVQPNATTSQRSATLRIGGRTVSVTQASAVVVPPQTCTYSIAPASPTVGPASTTLSVSVTTQSGCTWTTGQVDKWLDSESTGTGSGTARVDVQRYKGSGQRVGTITIAGQTFTVTQTK